MTVSQFGPWQGLRLAMVVGTDGLSRGSDGTSHSVSNPEDRAQLMALRALADLIVTDANTAEREGYRQSKLAPIQVWSRNPGARTWRPIEAAGGQPVNLIDSSDLPRAVQQLGPGAVLLETGPNLSRLLMPWMGSLAITVPTRDVEVARRATLDLLANLAADLNEWEATWSLGESNSYALFARRGRR